MNQTDKPNGDRKPEEESSGGLALVQLPEGLTLTDGFNQLRVDFTHMKKRIRQGNLQQELLVRAAKVKKEEGIIPTVLDATAGFAEDSMLLAAAGFHVVLYERDAVIAALVRDGLERAALIPELESAVLRMELFEEDSIKVMRRMAEWTDSGQNVRANFDEQDKIDVIFLDPMFPKRQKSALVKKKFQLLQQLEKPCTDAEELLQAAIAVHPRKIVIKRPIKGPWLAGMKPDYSISGKAIRYDCLVGR